MDMYLKMLKQHLSEITKAPGEPNPLEYAILNRELLKYTPNDSALLFELGTLLKRSGFFWEAYVLIRKGLELQPNYQMKNVLQELIVPPLPKTVTIEPITICNLKCPLCTNGTGRLSRKGRMMSFQEFKIIWDKVKSFARMMILVGQGETFLHPDAYRMLAHVGHSAYTYVDTNGNVDLDPDRIIDSGLDEMVFSIDGIHQEMYEKYRIGGNFKKAIGNVSKVVEAKRRRNVRKPKVVFKFIIFKHTEMYTEEAKQFAKDLGVNEFRLEPCSFRPKYGIEKFREFLPLCPDWQRIEYVDFLNDRIGKTQDRYSRHCTVPNSNIVINVNGNVAPCCAIDSDAIQSFGNLLTDKIDDIWASEYAKRFRLQVLEDQETCHACRTCSFPIDDFSAFLRGTAYEDPPKEDVDTSHRQFVSENFVTSEEISHMISSGKIKEAEYFISLGKVR